ncbi:hypothetical protein Pla163_36750 [Planctomycetes bacterium Pla163]|uniref:Uncharacterized protein n=1 Tax=Rohdeia mirabilis TaxID=2528008 RepID=A0A518D4Y8_9BACT|nr:hypothetical protein Pla163_36750 [Planctomycetes bacterium Pla163]
MLARTLVALTALSLPAAAQGVFAGSYTFAALNYEVEGSCPNGLRWSTQSGTLSFALDGTFTLASNERSACVGNGSASSSNGGSGVYSLSAAGDVVLDLDPGNPGTNIARLVLSHDRELLLFDHGPELDFEGSLGRAEFVIGIRGGVASTNAALQGDYVYGQIDTATGSTAIQTTARWGAFTFDGSGGWTGSVETATSLGGGAVTPPTSLTPGTYGVAANGALQMSGGYTIGALSQSGRVGFVLFTESSTTSLRVLLKRSPAASTDALVGRWAYSSLTGDTTLGPFGQVAMEAERGDLLVDARTNDALRAQVVSWADANGGGGRVAARATEPFVRANGSVLVDATDTTGARRAWLGAGEDVVLAAELSTERYGIGLYLRRWGSLAGDRSFVSSSDGGVQRLSIRAGAANAGRVYLVVGSTSGFAPGISGVPVNFDAYTLATATSPNTAPLTQSLGLLDARGRAQATFTLPAPSPAFVGTTFTHACLVLDPLTGATTLISNPETLTILP